MNAYEIPLSEAVLGDLFPFAEFLQRNVLEDLSDPDEPVDRLIAAILDLDGNPDWNPGSTWDTLNACLARPQ